MSGKPRTDDYRATARVVFAAGDLVMGTQLREAADWIDRLEVKCDTLLDAAERGERAVELLREALRIVRLIEFEDGETGNDLELVARIEAELERV